MKNKILFLGILIVLLLFEFVSANPLSFNSGDKVQVINTLTAGLKVRSSPAGTLTGAIEYDGTIGTIMSDSPQYAVLGGINYHWYRIDWGGGIVGWSADGYPGGVDYLKKIVVNNPPVLSNGYVTPTSGGTSTAFNYYVTYKDIDGNAPAVQYVYIDGTAYTMNFVSGSYVTGAVYSYSKTLSSSTHNYYFYFDDGQTYARIPSSGIYSGPTVSQPNQIPTCSLSSTPRSGIAPLTVTFNLGASDSDGSINAWVLDTNGDGNADYSGTSNPPSTRTHTYTNPGAYSVVFLVGDNSGANSNPCLDTINVGSNNPPTASLSASPLSGEAPLTVGFGLSASDSDGYIANWILNYGDGVSDSGNGNPPGTKSHIYSSPGVYSAILSVYDNNNVNTFSMKTITVNQPIPQVTLSLYVHEGTKDGQIISGARVTGTDASKKSFDITSDSNGLVSITGVPGTWNFTASKTGYQTVSWSQTINLTGRKDAYLLKENSPISLVITSPLLVNPIKSQYDVSDILTAQFKIKNIGSSPIKLDVLTVGGRDPDNLVIDFHWQRNVTIEPSTEYLYSGQILSLLSKAGNYHFFCTFKTLDGYWNTNIDLGTGLVIEDREEDITVIPKYYLSSVPLVDRGGIIIPRETFPEGQGKMIPIYVPEVIDGSNEIREDGEWANIKIIEKANVNWPTVIEFLLGMDHIETSRGSEQLVISAAMNTFTSFIDSTSISKYKLTIQQKGSENKFRAIIEQGGYPSPLNSLAGIDEKVFINPKDNIYLPTVIAEVFHLEPCPFFYDYWVTGNIDLLHKNNEYLYYLSVANWDALISTPKVYPADAIRVKKVYDFNPFDKETVVELKGESYASFFSRRINYESSQTIKKALAQIYFVKNLTFIIQEHSSGELRVYDSNENVTGIVNGIVREEIPFSMYDNETKTVFLSDPSSVYHYDIVGTVPGTYGLTISSIGKELSQEFNAVNISISNNTVYQYQIDWNNLSQGNEGVTVKIDSQGDGIFEQTVSTGEIFQGIVTCNENNDCDDSNLHTQDNCNNPGTTSSSCTYTAILCLNNEECGNSRLTGNLFCESTNLFQNFLTYTCNNPGTSLSYCSNSTTIQLNQTCGNNSLGIFGNNYCKNSSIYHNKTDILRGCSGVSCFTSNVFVEEIIQNCTYGCSNGICNIAICIPQSLKKTCGTSTCGNKVNNCGTIVSCGTCKSSQTCTNNKCVNKCVPKTCSQLRKTCGVWSDGCGGTLNCGTCLTGRTCSNGKCAR